MTRVQIVSDLLAAARILDERGWVQGTTQTKTGEVCLVGALRIATVGQARGIAYSQPDIERFHAARIAVHTYLIVSSGWKSVVSAHRSSHFSTATWNDMPGRTQAEVRAALLGAAGVV